MNKQIKELALQANPASREIYEQDNWQYNCAAWSALDLEKFAELIVGECMGCCEQVISDPVPESVDTWLNGGEQCIQESKEHFGLGMSVADKKQLIKDLLGVQK